MESSPHRVDDVMTRATVAVGRNALFKDIVERMERWKVSALPVLEGDGRVIGWSPKPICSPRRSSGTAILTGSPTCAGCPTSPRPGRSVPRS